MQFIGKSNNKINKNRIMKLTGKIKVISEVQEGTSKAGKDWKKLTFVIANNEGYENREQIFAFDIFGAEKVDKFLQYNKVDYNVDVSFNIESKEFKGKYYTNLSAWSVFKAEAAVEIPEMEGTTEALDDSLPF